MLDGPSTPDIATGFTPPIEVKAPQNFTSLQGKDFYENRINPPVYESPTVTEPPKFEEPTTTPDINRLMADILTQGKPKNPQEAVKQVEKKMPEQVKQNQGFLAKVLEWFFNFFTFGLFKKK